jgi:hypothetical protein
MQLPFTLSQFLDLFARYNEAIGPAPILLSLLAIGALLLPAAPWRWRHGAVRWILALLAAWTGVVYHWAFFTRINPAAWLFGLLFVGEAAVLMLVARQQVVFEFRRDAAGVGGLALAIYALFVYPLLGWAAAHGYPAGPSFGAPCPTTIFILGMLMWARPRPPVRTLVLPALWAVVGTSAALQLGIREDLALPIAAAMALVVALRRPRVSPERIRGPVATTRHQAPEEDVPVHSLASTE